MRQVIKYAIVLFVVFTLYIILFNPNLSPDLLSIVKPIAYVGEAILFFGSLYLINSINLGESDLGIWGVMVLSGIAIFFGVMFFFFSVFIPKYTGIVALFGLILIVLAAFMAFRVKRRHGQFIYVR